jgi:hypothetical protein
MDHLSRRLARFAVNLRYEHLDERSISEAKRFLLDSLGCALGGIRTHDAKIMRAFIEEEGGRAEATLIGTRRKVPATWPPSTTRSSSGRSTTTTSTGRPTPRTRATSCPRRSPSRSGRAAAART